jgi:DNA-binding transcriptional regulator YhcF (GntR family)
MPPEAVDSNRYLYEQIYSELKEEILSGKYRKGAWFPPERVLKERFKTTHLTVRNALAKLVLEGYIERYSGKGTIVIYARERPSSPRKLLSFPWAHVICEELDEANAFLLESLEAQLRKVPLPVRFSCHHGDVLLAQSIYREAEESGALVILQPAGPMESPGLSTRPRPNTILIRTPVSSASCPQVVMDDAEGARRAVRHLRDLGHVSIALLSAAALSPGFRQGFVEELSARSEPRGSGFVESCAPGVEGGAQAAGNILIREPACRAFLCASDETAVGAINGLRNAGLSPGADSAVVSWGNTRLARAMRLTSIDPGFERLAERVLATVMEGMSRGAFAGDVFQITPELLIRSSTGTVSSSK